MRPINVLVVDDSAFMRRAISKMLEGEQDIVVCATARSGEEGVSKAMQYRPDVITMDVEMPGAGGLEAVRQIMAQRRTPIIMVSSLTRDGADTTFRALELGAVDFIAKPDAAYVNITAVARDLIAKVRTFAHRPPDMSVAFAPSGHGSSVAVVVPRILTTHAPPSVPTSHHRVGRDAFECVAIGTSTGGPVALSRLIPKLPGDFPCPIVIVQHMPLGFTRPLADRLNSQSKLTVVEAAIGMPLRPGEVLIVPSGKQLSLRNVGHGVEVNLHNDDGSSLHVPSVDIMTEAVAQTYGRTAIGVVMTGMGQDGVRGLRLLKNRGGFVVGQDEATCVVYGMPRAAAKEGLVDRVAPLDEIPTILCDLTARDLANS